MLYWLPWGKRWPSLRVANSDFSESPSLRGCRRYFKERLRLFAAPAQHHSTVPHYANSDLKTDKAFVLNAVQLYGVVLFHTDPELKQNKEVGRY